VVEAGASADRPIARKYLLTVLAKSNATLEAISDGLIDLQDFEAHPHPSDNFRRSTPSPARLGDKE
jgi:hypothetical protein